MAKLKKLKVITDSPVKELFVGIFAQGNGSFYMGKVAFDSKEDIEASLNEGLWIGQKVYIGKIEIVGEFNN